MTQFHEDQEVEVLATIAPPGRYYGWHKAKIVPAYTSSVATFDRPPKWQVQFPDNTRAVFDAEHIRPVCLTDLEENMDREATE